MGYLQVKHMDLSTFISGNVTICKKTKHLQGIKVSLSPAPVSKISNFDYDVLHLVWTTERLQQQLNVIDRRCEM